MTTSSNASTKHYNILKTKSPRLWNPRDTLHKFCKDYQLVTHMGKKTTKPNKGSAIKFNTIQKKRHNQQKSMKGRINIKNPSTNLSKHQ